MIEDPLDAVTASADPDKWCILRTAGSRTLPLARSLAASGMDVWTPTEHRVKRIPRSMARRQSEAPILPTFVFARARHLPTLRASERREVAAHPPFSLFRYLGEITLVSDVALNSLRELDSKARPKFLEPGKGKMERTYAAKDRVRVTEGAGKGLSGEVVECDGKYTLVFFGGAHAIKITTSILQPDRV